MTNENPSGEERAMEDCLRNEKRMRQHYINYLMRLPGCYEDPAVQRAVESLLDPEGKGKEFSEFVRVYGMITDKDKIEALHKIPLVSWEGEDGNQPVMRFGGVEGARNYLRFISEPHPELWDPNPLALPTYSELLQHEFERTIQCLLEDGIADKVDTEKIWRAAFQENPEAQKLEKVSQDIRTLLCRIAAEGPQPHDLGTLRTLFVKGRGISHPEYPPWKKESEMK